MFFLFFQLNDYPYEWTVDTRQSEGDRQGEANSLKEFPSDLNSHKNSISDTESD